MLTETLTALDYTPTTHPDVASRRLNHTNPQDRGWNDGPLYCSCRTTAIGVIRHIPTGYRELYCGNKWHRDLQAFIDRADEQERYWAGLRAQDDVVIAANPDSDYARDLAAQWAAMVRQPGMPE